jgi:hypothetical protein
MYVLRSLTGACIAGNDFGECYDRAAHSIAAVLLQRFGAPQAAIDDLLATMETMRFFLQTGLENRQHCMVVPMRNGLLGMEKVMQLQAPVL